ncbi:tetraacyldisaccharide 4'-kinase [Desulfosediminicola flagellatus]|uniref:tetraacyldisaccharide 4'-kinase n=1 Tax=Desulfosediminicola flagellatus TaxID=2569541 RepID=UPI0010AD1E79|nr:tetraacyldisaccharide 4'-kinase [Desulfosediminicola flagellatus]
MMKPLDAFFLAGRLVSPLYSFVMRIRSAMYQAKLLRVEYLPVPVISVGNLTMGGTGKTPTVRLIAELLLENGFSPAIISRGYGGTAKSPVNIVSDRNTVHLSPEEAGDEPFMLASTLEGIPVLTGKKRIFPCRYAVENLNCNLIILDDGFQHMSVHRDVDIVLFNGTSLAGNGRVFPGGELREPYNALKRAHLFMITGVTDQNAFAVDEFTTFLKKDYPGVPVCISNNIVAGIFDKNGKSITEFGSHTYFTFSGIAHPERFLHSMQQYNISVSGNVTFNDHATYTQEALNTLVGRAKESSASAILTTEKDIVKIREYDIDFPLHYLKISASAASSFYEFLQTEKFINP